MHLTIPYSSGAVEIYEVDGREFEVQVPVYPSSGEITNPGEIAISTLDGYEAICIKSDQNENVLFSDDAANQTKLSSWYNSANGGLSLAQHNENGAVLSLSEGVPLEDQTIITNARTLYVVGHDSGEQSIMGYSLTPLNDSESCLVYGYQDNLPDNLSEMKDIKINIMLDKSNTLELTINEGSDIRKLNIPNYNAFFCNSIHGLENLPSKQIHTGGSLTGETVPGYELKHTINGDITASFAESGESGCIAAASHAEGSHPTTSAVGSHAEGHNTSTSGSGWFSHCEGNGNYAEGLASSVHNFQSYAYPGATGASVYGYQNNVTNLGEFACGEGKENNIVATAGRLFSVADGVCVVQTNTAPMLQALQCTPHSVFKILSGSTSGNTYYYPLIDISDVGDITRNLVITATVGGGDPQTKTLDEWYTYLTSGGN